MNGLNKQFLADPVVFLKSKCVDNKTMQEGVEAAKHITQLNGAKVGAFDLITVKDSLVRLTYAVVPEIKNDAPIFAYWCPFLPGMDLPGWVDIPKSEPKFNFVLTAAMQGCAFIITNSPASEQSFRVFHNQHPEDKRPWAAMEKEGATKIVSKLSYEQYGNAIDEEGGMTNAFNLLWKPPDKNWSYVSQSNKFVPLPKGTKIERDTSKPILDLPAGV